MQARRRTLAERLETLLARHWWQAQPTLLARLLQPISWLYGTLARVLRKTPASRVGVPTLVVGNVVAGGAGKTPAVIALIDAFVKAGRKPGVVSRGHGRSIDGLCEVQAGSTAQAVGDEPLLIARRTGVPVWVGRDRSAAAHALCAKHPGVDVLVSDDGLQHHALARDAELLVFDDRGTGNGLLLPAGPLREFAPRQLHANQRVLYTGLRASTPLPGALARRSLVRAWPLSAWMQGDESQALPLQALQSLQAPHEQPCLAVAGLATPERFFAMLQAQGLRIERLPLPDHFDYSQRPWPAETALVLTTEKDAVKLQSLALGSTRVWVLPLDFALPAGLAEELLTLLPLPTRKPPSAPQP
jgi:tetraacyldisaccharide 4'-kinase